MKTIRELFAEADARAIIAEDERSSNILRTISAINGVAVLLKGVVMQLATRNSEHMVSRVMDEVGGHVHGFAGAWPTPMGVLVVFEPKSDLDHPLRRLTPLIEAGWDIQIRIRETPISDQYLKPCDHTMSHPEKAYGGVLYCLRCGHQLGEPEVR